MLTKYCKFPKQNTFPEIEKEKKKLLRFKGDALGLFDSKQG
jgi:hypothetical protein